MTPVSTVWLVSSYDLGGNTGYVIEGIFSNQEAAEAFKAYRPDEYEIEEHPLRDAAQPQWKYYSAITHVYPDGTMERGAFDEHIAEGDPVDIDSADVFDGHMQSHCGVHIYVCGRDEKEVRSTYRRLVAQAKREATGTCSCGRTELWQRDWMDDPLRDREREECAKTHTEGWCPRCCVYTMRISSAAATVLNP